MAESHTDRSLLDLSDEEFTNLDPSTLSFEEPEPEEDPERDTEEESDAAVEDFDSEDDADSDRETSEDSAEAEEEDDAAAESSDEAEGEDAPETEEEEEGDEDAADPKKPADDAADETEEAAQAAINYEAEYKKLLAPFKANGREMKVNNVEEAVQLMQMGANYNKKMTALKPNLKLLKMLENNQLLDEDKLSFYIDLDKKNPEAIRKFIKDSGVDPLDIDVNTESEYRPSTYNVDDREIALDEVLDTLQDTPTYGDLVDLVSNKWDGPSKQIVANNPQVLEVINDHMASGIYDRISNEVERERALGRLKGLSDLDAYKQIGDALNAQGAFTDLVQSNPAPAAAPAKKVAPPSKPKAEDPKLKSKKRAASSTKAAAPKPKDQDFNPLSLSDEEFAKLGNQQFM